MQTYIVTEKVSAKALPLPFTVEDGSYPDMQDIANAFAVRGIIVTRPEVDIVGPYDIIQQPITIVVNHTNGLVDEVLSTAPVRIIFIDDDVEGGDPDCIQDINGTERYIHDAEAIIDTDRVASYVAQVDAG